MKLITTKKKPFIKCECCLKRVEKMGNMKYCGNCAVSKYILLRQIASLKHELKVAKEKVYELNERLEMVKLRS